MQSISLDWPSFYAAIEDSHHENTSKIAMLGTIRWLREKLPILSPALANCLFVVHTPRGFETSPAEPEKLLAGFSVLRRQVPVNSLQASPVSVLVRAQFVANDVRHLLSEVPNLTKGDDGIVHIYLDEAHCSTAIESLAVNKSEPQS